MKHVARWLSAVLLLSALSLPAVAHGQTPVTKPLPKPPATMTATPARSAAMANQDVIDMLAGGLSDQFVIASIRRTTNHAFDLNPQGLIALKKAAVAEAVNGVMLDPSADPVVARPGSPAPAGRVATMEAPQASRVTAPVGNQEDVKQPHPTGIYVDLGPYGGGLTQLEANRYGGGKTGGVFKPIVTAGIAKEKRKAVASGPRANQRIGTPTPTFYFEVTNAGLSGTGGSQDASAAATSPNEFIFARRTANRTVREPVVGEVGTFRASTCTRAEDTIDVKTEQRSPGIFRVTPVLPMAPGEHCVFHAGSASAVGPRSAWTTGRLFDFLMDAKQEKVSGCGWLASRRRSAQKGDL
jgi:hypothetical protein